LKEQKLKDEEEQLKRNLEAQKIREWEEKFDEGTKIKIRRRKN
jgi:hypothetical protein